MRIGIKLLWVLGILISAFVMWFGVEDIASPKKKEEPLKQEKEKKLEEKQKMVMIERSSGIIETVELETYVRGVVASEMPVSFELEALKAQSVAARTFVLKRGLLVDDTTSSQVYKNDEELQQQWGEEYEEKLAKIKKAVEATKGEVLTYQGNYITASFFSSCVQRTNYAKDYWQGDTPYLISVESPWDQTVNKDIVQTQTFLRGEVSDLLGFQNPISVISDIVRFESGYVKELSIDTIIFSGREIRERLQLRSNRFTVDIVGEEVVFKVEGFGHGIGMSQYGAQGMAKAGKKYQEILLHYYTGVRLEKR